jgi:hypothetical protein
MNNTSKFFWIYLSQRFNLGKMILCLPKKYADRRKNIHGDGDECGSLS